MNTFLPSMFFDQSARCLDSRRLGKQRVECLQILRAFSRCTQGWRNHPAARMWRGYENSLMEYSNAMILEWLSRGYRNTMELYCSGAEIWSQGQHPAPPWLGDPAFHASHRSSLLRKDPIYYGQFGWLEPQDLPYVWPPGAAVPAMEVRS